MIRYAREPHVLWRHSGDQVLLVAPGSTDVLVLGASGLALWAALVEPASLDAVAEELAAVFDVPTHQVRTDLNAIVADLEERRVIKRYG